MPHRDPQTGQFLPHDQSSYDDIEVATFGATVGVEASNLSGDTGFSGGDINEYEGLEVIDYDEIVDRNEELRLLRVDHRIDVFVNSTETADGTVAASMEISADPALADPAQFAVVYGNAQNLGGDTVTIDSGTGKDDSIDTIGRPLISVGTGPFSDGSTGVGGGGASGTDEVVSTHFPAEFGRFHPRDELFANGRIVTWNIDDAGVHVSLSGQHVYGVLED